MNLRVAQVLVALLLAVIASGASIACQNQAAPDRRVATPFVVAPESPTPSLNPISEMQSMDISGQETTWRVWITFVDRPKQVPPVRVSPTPSVGYRLSAEGQFIVVGANVENIGNAVPTLSVDLGDAVMLTDASGREYRPLRGSSAAYTLTLPGAPGNPYEARPQPSRGVPYAFVFDVPASATGLQFTGRGATTKVPIR